MAITGNSGRHRQQRPSRTATASELEQDNAGSENCIKTNGCKSANLLLLYAEREGQDQTLSTRAPTFTCWVYEGVKKAPRIGPGLANPANGPQLLSSEWWLWRSSTAGRHHRGLTQHCSRGKSRAHRKLLKGYREATIASVASEPQSRHNTHAADS